MSEMFNMSIHDMAGKTFPCSCGKTHVIHTQKIILEPDAIYKVLDNGLPGTPFVIADENTWPLSRGLFDHLPHYILQGSELHADDCTLGKLLIETSDKDVGYFIALGSGTIGDSVRFLAYRLNKPFVNVCTAPSMDGAASCHSPLIHENFKVTYQAAAPYAIYFDLNIMANAPQKMIAAGYADVVGKYVAAVDWKIGHWATGEDYCPEIQALTLRAVKKCEESCEGLASRDPLAIKTLAEALLLSSMAMQLNITSRPASGMEHLVSHAWENLSIKRGEPVSLHGDKVGIGTLIACDVFHEFFREMRVPQKPLERINYDCILEHWDELKAESDHLWEIKDRVARQIHQAGGPVRPVQLGISPEDVKYGLYHLTVGRPRVTIAHLIKALNLEDEIYNKVIPKWTD